MLIGVGGDSLALGASVCAIGALTLGMLFVGVFPAAAVGVPITVFTSGIPLILTTMWGLLRGQSVLAGIFGTVAGLFTTFGFPVLGLDHSWFAIPAADVPSAQAVYFIAFACYFLFSWCRPCGCQGSLASPSRSSSSACPSPRRDSSRLGRCLVRYPGLISS